MNKDNRARFWFLFLIKLFYFFFILFVLNKRISNYSINNMSVLNAFYSCSFFFFNFISIRNMKNYLL